jgi:hypothetical protein
MNVDQLLERILTRKAEVLGEADRSANQKWITFHGPVILTTLMSTRQENKS